MPETLEKTSVQKSPITPEVFQLKRDFFDLGSTLNYSFRSDQLKRLEEGIKRNEKEIIKALHTDLRKSEMEAYMTEISIVIDEINYLRKRLEEWMSPIKRDTPLAMQPSTTTMRYEPKGVVLIIAPWNYPFQLVMDPLAGAIAAGCCAVVKPSEDAPATAKIVEDIISEVFNPSFVSTVQGLGHEVVPELMNSYEFNHVFFTGSPQVGSAIAKMAAAKLTSTTLELGGKSPAIIDGTGSMKTTVKRLLWGKFMNAGQTCVSPDYVLVKEGFRDQFLKEAEKVIEDFFGKDPKSSDSFPRIINLKRFDAIKKLMTSGDVMIGGQSDRDDLYIAPTILANVSLDDEVMKEEIFGPILPIITWQTEKEILDIVRRNRYPLACYYFGKNKALQDFILSRIEFGGGCVNNTLVQFGNPDLPVGGLQQSGSGHYHGFYSFECFSNAKTIVDSATWIDPPIKYPPYTKTKLSWIRRILG